MLVGLLTRARHTCAVESPEADTTSSWEGWKRTEFTLPLWPSYCRRQASDVTHHKRQDWSEKSHEWAFYETIFNLGTNWRQVFNYQQKQLQRCCDLVLTQPRPTHRRDDLWTLDAVGMPTREGRENSTRCDLCAICTCFSVVVRFEYCHLQRDNHF